MLGKTLGHYEILESLGSGGMADVYVAEDTKHHRRVAVKVLRQEATASVGPERFLEEIQITASLQHPHILQLFDSGEIDGRLYYVMPRIEGESLAERLRRGRLPLDEAVEIARQVGAALEYAHRHGVVHRDIKPANIMLQAGQAMVADFGIARALADEDRTRLTAVGLTIGTPSYMSPEQAAGEYDVDERADVYSLGVVLYEMLAGTPPFTGSTAATILSKVLTEDPPPLGSIRPEVPAAIATAVERALAKRPADRQPSVAALVGELGDAPTPQPTRLPRLTKTIAATGLAAIVVASVVASAAMYRSRNAAAARDWARVEAIPQVQDLLNEAEVVAAFELASRALAILPDDPTLMNLLEAASGTIDIDSQPSGALASYRPYDGGAWVELGRTPLKSVRLPGRELALRMELDGYPTDERIILPSQPMPVHVRLEPPGEHGDTVWVPAGAYALGEEPVALADFRIDRTEVTNDAYQSFVDAGGYGEAADWVAALAAHDVALDGARAVDAFVDATGRPGPAAWELSRHAPESADYPVRGVSWFEAVAFCDWAGKDLPTYYHWKLAVGLDVRDNMVVASNLATGTTGGPIAVGSTASFGVNGTVDMAGNVREWVWNASRDGRYVLGGAWDAQAFVYTSYEAADPWNRSLTNGFRCARYDEPPARELLVAIDEPFFDFTDYTPVDDETFANFARFYEYDYVDLAATRTVVEENDEWTRELVEITAAYSGERIPLHVFLPRNAEPPYQTVVYFPGVTAFYLASSENLAERSALMFLPRSGRALVYPVVKHTYERRKPDNIQRTPTLRRQETIWMTQDIMRAVDYIVERPALDESKIAYMGLSFGAELAVPVAIEKRFRALVLVGAALDPAWLADQPDEAGPWNFVFRITTPTILINGDTDVMHPYNEGQVPFFEAIDVPEDDKRFVLSSGGHLPAWNEVIRHTLDWLDERLGPVARPDRR